MSMNMSPVSLHSVVRLVITHLLALCLLWIIVPFLPASNLLTYVGTLIAERLLYLPSTGLCLMLSYFLIRISQRLSFTSPSQATRCILFSLRLLFFSSSMASPLLLAAVVGCGRARWRLGLSHSSA